MQIIWPTRPQVCLAERAGQQVPPSSSKASYLGLSSLIPDIFSAVQYYLPDESVINKDFLKDVLAGEKNLMKKSKVDHITVPK